MSGQTHENFAMDCEQVVVGYLFFSRWEKNPDSACHVVADATTGVTPYLGGTYKCSCVCRDRHVYFYWQKYRNTI